MASEHARRIETLRAGFDEAHRRLTTRLRGAAADPAPAAGEGWTAAQIGAHVAAVTGQFAAVVSGEVTAMPFGPEFRERPWPEIAAGIPERLSAPAAAQPPDAITMAEALELLDAAAARMHRALDGLTAERGASHGISHRIVGGPISLYQVVEWATAHIIRHNQQAKRVLGR